ncbi:MAG: hypothetical protein JWO15_681 [Sphingomonadales bacterium]|nr:hypothetical protein [Sphingomonadales bacterium]
MLRTTSLSAPLKSLLRSKISSIFNDVARGEAPVVRQEGGLFGSGSVAWRVHGDVTSMMVGGVASLLMQMLHPSVLAGVWDHSNFRSDMHGRLRRTARFIAMTTYGTRHEAESVIDRVRTIHGHVKGHLPDGTPYVADDPSLLAWVHITETTSFLDAWIRYSEPLMSLADQDRYFAETAVVGEALGAHELPRSRAATMALIEAMRPQLQVDDRTREVARLILSARSPGLVGEAPRILTMQAGIDLLPRWARDMHGLSVPNLGIPIVRAGTLGIAQALRWAFS